VAKRSGSLRDLLMPFLAEIPRRAKDREWVVARAMDHGVEREQRLEQMFTGDELARDGTAREREVRERQIRAQLDAPKLSR
jgi:hypothetical protein